MKQPATQNPDKSSSSTRRALNQVSVLCLLRFPGQHWNGKTATIGLSSSKESGSFPRDAPAVTVKSHFATHGQDHKEETNVDQGITRDLTAGGTLPFTLLTSPLPRPPSNLLAGASSRGRCNADLQRSRSSM